VRELGKRILDAHKRETGQISLEFRNSIDKHIKTSFLRGLNREIIISKEGMFEEIESRAIDAEKELEAINMIRRVVLAENTPTEKRAPIRRIEAEIIICQFCHKKGHTADRCWQINKFQGANGNKNLINPGTLHGNNNTDNNIRIPPFLPEEPELWFMQLEGQFSLCGITDDEAKYAHVLSKIEPKQAREIKDIITRPPVADKYKTLKRVLIQRLTDSQEQRIRQLLE